MVLGRRPLNRRGLTALGFCVSVSLAWTFSPVPTAAGVPQSAAPVNCSPPPGSSIVVGDTVSCAFAAPTGGGTFDSWSAAFFTPSTSLNLNQQFIASATGQGSITIAWTANGVQESAAVTYNIVPSTAIANCSPGNGSQITVTQGVSCTFKGGPGLTFVGWGGKLFAPNDSTSMSQTFTPLDTGSGGITVFWNVAGGGEDQETFSYRISPATSIASCNPPNNADVAPQATVTCSFHSPTGTNFVGWQGTQFAPGDSTSLTQAFEPLALGQGSITAEWDDQSHTPHQETFNYNIVPMSVNVGPSCVAGSTAALNGGVDWASLKVGKVVVSWGDGSETEGKAPFPSSHTYTRKRLYTILVRAFTGAASAKTSTTVDIGGKQTCRYSLVPKSPIAKKGSLKGGATRTFEIQITGAEGAPLTFAPVWVSFGQAKGGGSLSGVAESGRTKVGSKRIPFVVSSGSAGDQIALTYAAPKRPPSSGTDIVKLWAGEDSKRPLATDSYSF